MKKNKSKNKTKPKATKYLLNIFLVLVVTVFSLYFSLRNNFDVIVNAIFHCDGKYLLLAILAIIGMIAVRSFILFCFARLYTRQYHYHQAVALDQIGNFYSSVTPGATGGEFMQAVTYKKQGLQISSAVSILAMYSIVYQIVLIIYGIASLAFKYDFISTLGSIGPFRILDVEFSLPLWPLTILGFIVNASVIVVVFLMSYWRGFHNFVLGPIISLLAKLKIVKHPDRTRERLRTHVINFKIELRHLLTNIPFFILVAILFFVYLTLKFSIPYFCGLSCGMANNDQFNFFDCICLSNYHQMITGLIPIPGSAGVSELFYFQLFSSFFLDSTGAPSSTILAASLVMWRSLTFTIPIIIAGFVTAFYRASPKDEEGLGQNELPSRGNFIDLQNETYTLRKDEVDNLILTTRLSRDAVLAKLRSEDKKEEGNTAEIPVYVRNEDYTVVDISSEKQEEDE